MYVMNITRFQLSDILVFIAGTCNSALKTGMDDIAGFLSL